VGCDIHLYSETKTKNGWEINEKCYWSYWNDFSDEYHLECDYDDHIYSGSNYALFGLLAGVRSQHELEFEPMGFPRDASIQMNRLYKQWDGDAHTPSYLTSKELLDKIKELKENGLYDPDDDKYLVESLQKILDGLGMIDKEGEKRIVFWFDS
jgi:hypothetical protein